MRVDDRPQNFPQWMRWVERKLRWLEQRPTSSGGGGGGGVTSVNGDTGPAVVLAAADVGADASGAAAAAQAAAATDATTKANAAQAASQPLDSDLTTIAGLTATTDNFIQAKSSAWASRTVAQVKTDLGIQSPGMAADGKPTINTMPASAATEDDEFNDGTGMSGPVNGLNAKWTKRNMGTAGWSVLDDTKAPGCFLFDIPAGNAQDQAIRQTAPAGDFRIVCRAMLAAASDRQMWGPCVLDSSGNGVALLLDDPAGDGSTRLRAVSAWVQSSALVTVSSTMNAAWIGGQPVYMSLRKASGVYHAAVWGADRSLPPIMAEVNATPSAFTPAYVGFGRFYGAGGASTGSSKVLVDWFRKT